MPPSLEQPVVDPRFHGPRVANDGESSSKPIKETKYEDIPKEEDDVVERERQLNRFGAHCRTFYESSVSVRSSLSSDDGSGVARRESAAVARSVLAAFGAACHGGGGPVVSSVDDDEEIRIAIQRCGLSDPVEFRKPELRSMYSSVRNDARRDVHADQARKRADRLRFLLSEREAALEIVDEEEEDDDDGTTARRVEIKRGGWTGTVRTSSSRKRKRRRDRPFSVRTARKLARTFSSKYAKNVGCHPFLAGLRRLIERQISRDDRDKVLIWTFSGLTLTENCAGGEDGDGDSFAVDAIDLLLSFLRRSSTNEKETTATMMDNAREEVSPEERAEEGRQRLDENDEQRLSWEVRPNVSDRDLRIILRVLPRKTDLHGRPTGEVTVSDRRRIPTNEKNEVALAFLKLWKR